MGRPNESLSTAGGGAIDPWVRAGSKFARQRRVLRLSKPPRRWKVPSYADYVKRNIREVYITLAVLTGGKSSLFFLVCYIFMLNNLCLLFFYY